MLKQPHIKVERTSSPEQHLLQRQKQPYRDHQQGAVSAILADPDNSSAHINYRQDRETERINSQLKNDDIESLPDFQSIKGMFGWTTIDGVNIPYILRSDKQFVSVRIVEMKLLSRYPKSFSSGFKRCAPIKSFSVTENEAKLLNEINTHHCDEEYGTNNFDTKALIIPLTDFKKLFDTIKNEYFDATKEKSKHHQQQKAGWLQVKNTVTPYLCREDGNYVPLYVIQYAAGLLTNKKVDSVIPTQQECDILNNLCKEVGVDFTFSEIDRLIKVKELLRVDPVDIITLPSSNPLKYVTFKDIRMNNISKSKQPEKSKTQMTEFPRIIQQNSVLDLPYINKEPTSYNHTVHTIEINETIVDKNAKNSERITKDESIRFAREQGKLAAMKQVRAMYTHSLKIPAVKQQNHEDQNNKQAQNKLQQQQYKHEQQRLQEFSNNLGAHGVKICENNVPTKLKEFGSLVDAFRRLGPYFGTQHSKRPPPLLSALHLRPTLLSPTNQRIKPLTENMVPFQNGLRSPLNRDMNIHQLQAIFAQRLSFDLKEEQSKLRPVGFPMLTSPSPISNIPADSSQTQSKSPFISIPKVSPSCLGEEVPQKSTTKAKSLTIDNLPAIEHIMPTNPNNGVAKETFVVPHHVGNKPTFEICTLNKESKKDATKPDGISHVNLPQLNQRSSGVDKMEGAWIGDKKISCLELKREDRQGRYCLVEAICQLYFEGCSVNQLLYALKKVLKVPLLTCTEDEQNSFIKYHNLPIGAIKCNKMISLEDLEACFPLLSYMFPDKNAIDAFLDQASGQGHGPSRSWNKLAPNGKQSTSKGVKRQQNDKSKKDRPRKRVKINASEDDAVIILD